MLQSANMEILLAVLNVIYVFAKRSNFLSRLYARLKSTLSSSLEFLGKVQLDTAPPTRTSCECFFVCSLGEVRLMGLGWQSAASLEN